MKIAIVANGVNNVTETDLKQADYVIAVDNGAAYCYLANTIPSVVIGDLDSVSADVRAKLREDNVTIMQYPQEKDDTDLQLAIQFAVENYVNSDIHLYSVMGGRDDMTLSNTLLLAHPEFANANIVLHGELQILQTITSEKLFKDTLPLETTVSLIPLSERVAVKLTKGLKYKLQNAILYFANTRSLCNEVIDENVVIEVSSGVLLISYQ